MDANLAEIIDQDPDAAEAALYGHLEVEARTGRKIDPFAPAANTLPNPVVPPGVVVPSEPPVADPTEPVAPADPAATVAEPAAPAAPADDPAAPPAEPAEPVATPPTPAPAPVDPTAGWSPVDKRASEIKSRNPDLTLEESLAKAKAELGITEPDPNAPAPEPTKTTAELLADVQARLKEAGAAEGLYTPEIAELTDEQARLHGILAVERAEAQRQQEEYIAEVNTAREASRNRVLEICPEANDPTTAIGRALSAEIEAATAIDHPDLYEPNAPEIFLAKANLRLPEAERVEMRRKPASPAPAAPQPTTPPSTAPAAAPTPPAPSSVLPVPASSRSAQPASINPADIGRITKEMPADELEAALYSGGGNGALLRM